jgi:4-hydroxy-3-polyprenylbenzoate decarboxylase
MMCRTTNGRVQNEQGEPDPGIDPTNINDVIWAMCTRCDPRDQLDIVHGGWSSALDPMCYDTADDKRNSRVIIDACIPFNRKKAFPAIARASKELDMRMRATWAKDLPADF